MSVVQTAPFAAAHADGAFVLDVREPFEYVNGHVPGAGLMPMGQVPQRMAELPRDQQVYVICQSGNRSLTVTNYLRSAGYDAVSVAGGTGGWIGAGRPVVMGDRPNAA